MGDRPCMEEFRRHGVVIQAIMGGNKIGSNSNNGVHNRQWVKVSEANHPTSSWTRQLMGLRCLYTHGADPRHNLQDLQGGQCIRACRHPMTMAVQWVVGAIQVG